MLEPFFAIQRSSRYSPTWQFCKHQESNIWGYSCYLLFSNLELDVAPCRGFFLEVYPVIKENEIVWQAAIFKAVSVADNSSKYELEFYNSHYFSDLATAKAWCEDMAILLLNNLNPQR